MKHDRRLADGYDSLATTLSVGFDAFLFADTSRPTWSELATPNWHDRRCGGDNTDANYAICPVDPKRRYRISDDKGDSVYFSVRGGHCRCASAVHGVLSAGGAFTLDVEQEV